MRSEVEELDRSDHWCTRCAGMSSLEGGDLTTVQEYRIMKKILPPDSTISPEGLRAVQNCVSVLVACVSHEAGLNALQNGKRKLVTGDDVCVALENLGLDQYGSLSKSYIQKFKEARTKVANGH